MVERKGLLFIVSAPSGTGKTTLCNMLLEEFSSISYSISYTTRLPRAGEKNGTDYHFIDKVNFIEMMERGEFLEHAIVHDNLYGTARMGIEEQLKKGDVLLDIDPQGAMQLYNMMGYAVYVFIVPPSMNTLKERLAKRNDTEFVETRLENARRELTYIPRYNYLIINDDLQKAYKELASIYIAARHSTKLIVDYSAIIRDN